MYNTHHKKGENLEIYNRSTLKVERNMSCVV